MGTLNTEMIWASGPDNCFDIHNGSLTPSRHASLLCHLNQDVLPFTAGTTGRFHFSTYAQAAGGTLTRSISRQN
jgi:hypothetical protein